MDQPELGATFRHEGVAAAYRYRPPYPEDVFDRLERRMLDDGRGIDLGEDLGSPALVTLKRRVRAARREH